MWRLARGRRQQGSGTMLHEQSSAAQAENTDKLATTGYKFMQSNADKHNWAMQYKLPCSVLTLLVGQQAQRMQSVAFSEQADKNPYGFCRLSGSVHHRQSRRSA